MLEQTLVPQTALKYDVEVQNDGHLEIAVPFAPGTHVVVFIVAEPDSSPEKGEITRIQDLPDLLAEVRAAFGDNPPRTGAEALAYWREVGAISPAPDDPPSPELARRIREQAQRRDRT